MSRISLMSFGMLKEANDGKLKLERGVGKFAAIMMCFNGIVGSGIFVSPKGIVVASQTPGFSMLMWFFVGILALFGALCYVEIGTVIPRTGGEYPVLDYVYGPMWAYSFAWIGTTILGPASMAVSSITFAKYCLSILSSSSADYETQEKALAIACCWVVVTINSYSMKLTDDVSKILGYIKITSLTSIVLLGVYALFTGDGSLDVFKPEKSFKNLEGETYLPGVGDFGIGLYAGIWAYNGWNKLNYIVEEIVEPEKNLLIAVCSSLALITLFYTVVNFMYFTVLGVEGILVSNAVAADFATTILGNKMGSVVPAMVACSCAGICMVQCLCTARIPFAAARNGQMPAILSMIHVDYLTPFPSVLLMGVFSTFLIAFNDVSSLLKYFGFATWAFYACVFTAVIILRKRKPNIDRSFSVPIWIPYVMTMFAIYLVSNTFYVELVKIGSDEKIDYGYFLVLLWLLVGIFVYVLQRKTSSKTLKNIMRSSTKKMQLFLYVAPEE